jgi:hypothetical protein
MSWYASHGKRALDIVGSAALLVVSLPIDRVDRVATSFLDGDRVAS